MRIRTLLHLALALVLSALPAAAQDGRVIVLGFDGADGRTAEALMDRGELPNLSKLRSQGAFAPLGTTVAAESPVAWASLNTGQNPAKTGVPGFIKRKIEDGQIQPDLGHQKREERTIRELAPGGLLGLLSSMTPVALSGAAAFGAFVFFFLVFAALLRMKRWFAFVLALILGLVGAVGAHRASTYVPESVPFVIGNPLQTESFWDHTADAGVPTIVLDAAMSWDRPERENLKILSGLGLPDIRGANGDWFVFTTDDFELNRQPEGRGTPTAGNVYRVDQRDGKIEAQLYGPENFYLLGQLRAELAEVEEKLQDSTRGFQENNRLRDRKRDLLAEEQELMAGTSLPLVVNLQGDQAEVVIGGHAQTLREGEWSDWFRLAFEINPLVKAHAITRVRIDDLDDPFRMFVNVLEIDPENPPFWQPVSQPTTFAGDLARSTGAPFETYGWACMTMPLKDEEVSVDSFLEDIEFTMAWRERITYEALGRDDWRVLMSVFSTTDRVQHMMYQYADPGHPLYDAEEAAREVTFFGNKVKLSEAIDEIYRQMDRVVGVVMDEHLRDGDTLMLCADHGFQSFRTGVHLNNWLSENGFLVPHETLSRGQRRMLAFADWSKTRAYAVGLGMIYINLKGREPNGIVEPEDKRKVMEEIREKMLATRDPQTGAPVIQRVTFIEDVHSGPYLDMECDLMPGFAPTYRVSWGTTLGEMSLTRNEDGEYVPDTPYEPNDSPWSGDHVSVDPEAVRGIFFSNRPVAMPEGGVDLLHIAPTVLDLVGVEVPTALDVPPLQFTD